MDTENQTIEESSNANLPTSNAVEKTIEENYKEEESDASESKEEVCFFKNAEVSSIIPISVFFSVVNS